MVKHILVRMNEEMFYKMKLDKQRRERELNKSFKNYKNKILTWEEYIKILFGFKK